MYLASLLAHSSQAYHKLQIVSCFCSCIRRLILICMKLKDIVSLLPLYLYCSSQRSLQIHTLKFLQTGSWLFHLATYASAQLVYDYYYLLLGLKGKIEGTAKNGSEITLDDPHL